MDVRAEQIKRLVRVGADEASAAALVDEHDPAKLVEQSDDTLESLVDGHRAKAGIDMSTINSVLLWVYGSEDEPQPDDVALARAQVAIELEEARRKPRRGVLDELREFLASRADEAAGGEPSANELAAQGVPVGDAADGGEQDGVATLPDVPNQPGDNDAELAVPDGSIKAVMAWVNENDDDRVARAQAALDAENAKDEPRSTLVSQLEDINTPPSE